MKDPVSYTTEDISQLLKVSKLTVYDLIKKGELPAYRVGRQMRVDAEDLKAYKEAAKTQKKIKTSGPTGVSTVGMRTEARQENASAKQMIISGQDISLDILANHLEKPANDYRPLRSYVGSLNSLFALVQGEADVVSTHLFDGDTKEYNLPYIKRILVNHEYMVIRLLTRWEGFYVQKGNPLNIQTWIDLTKKEVRFVNREKGSGVRVLVDEQLRIEGIDRQKVDGYSREESNHIGVASKIAGGKADVGVGVEKTAQIIGVDFIPLIEESYDLVILKSDQHEAFIKHLQEVLQQDSFQQEIKAIGGYDLSQIGKVVYET